MKIIFRTFVAAGLAAVLITMLPLSVVAQVTNSGRTQQSGQASGSNLTQRLESSPAFPDDQQQQQPDLTAPALEFDLSNQGRVIQVCAQPPIHCESNDECTCSHCCGDLAGIHLCQPTC